MTTPHPLTINSAAHLLSSGDLTAEALLASCFERIDDPAGEGRVAFTAFCREEALAEARVADALRRAGVPARPLSGIPISVKDIYDMAGWMTTAGSRVRIDAEAATRDCSVVARLREAGAVIVGRTNLSEFAFTGLGLNPHFGTPRAPWRRSVGHAPGGSSSGSAVSVADGMALGTVGSDTGGSGRIPAAFCGIVGFKPTRGRIPLDGTFPLAASFDTVAPLTHSVADCRLLAEVMAGADMSHPALPLQGLQIGVVPHERLGPHAPEVLAVFDTSLRLLAEAGVRLETIEDFDWSMPGRTLQEGRITAVEGLVAHGELFRHNADYDPQVAARLAMAVAHPAVAYVKAISRMASLRAEAATVFARYDAIVLPTVAIVPPPLNDLKDDETFVKTNLLVLRNTLIGNVLDACAVSLPLASTGGAPIGFMLMAAPGADARLLAVAEAVEAQFRMT